MSNKAIEIIRKVMRAAIHDLKWVADRMRAAKIDDKEAWERYVIVESALAEFEAEFGNGRQA